VDLRTCIGLEDTVAPTSGYHLRSKMTARDVLAVAAEVRPFHGWDRACAHIQAWRRTLRHETHSAKRQQDQLAPRQPETATRPS